MSSAYCMSIKPYDDLFYSLKIRQLFSEITYNLKARHMRSVKNKNGNSLFSSFKVILAGVCIGVIII